jgi:[NiFe] hydrogenase diaphorase moiety large subunit
MDKLAAGRGSRTDVDLLSRIDTLMHGTTHCGLGGSACNALHDTIAKFRPSYERRLKSLHFEPAFDLDAELAVARTLTGRNDAGAHLEENE